MPFLKKICPECGNAILVNTYDFGVQKIYEFKCKHWLTEDQIQVTDETKIDDGPSADGKLIRRFQEEAIRFALESNVNCLIADPTGAGKTIEALRTVSSKPKDLLPCAIFCKSKLKVQWFHETLRWLRMQYIPVVIESSKEFEMLVPGAHFYIFSQDLLRRFNGELGKKFAQLEIKTIIIDECQHIKNHQSQRAKAIREACKVVPHTIALSAHPILNRSPELFSILNILKPDKYPVYERFCRYYCDYYTNEYGQMKWGGLIDPESFMEETKEFIIRRKIEDILPELPKLDVQYLYADLGPKVEKAYQKLVEEFLDYEDRSRGKSFIERQGDLMAYLSKMRHLCGVAKIDTVVDYVLEFLEGTENEQICIFAHHRDVQSDLFFKLQGICKELGRADDIRLLMADTPNVEEIKQDFAQKKFRVLVLSTLAFGEGLNLQSCAHNVLAERQWNPGKEMQAIEGRFRRLGQTADRIVNVTAVALGTIDEWLAEIVERKRGICAQVLDGQEMEWSESEVIQEITKRLIEKGKRKWTYK